MKHAVPKTTPIHLAGGKTGTFSRQNARTQEAALVAMADVVFEDTAHPTVKNAAHQIIRDCPARDDEAELTAIFNAVKYGDPTIPGLEHGLKYVSDPRSYDYYVSPARMLELGQNGQALAGDCDDHAMLCAALAGSIGFRVGLRAWGPKGGRNFEHVYAIAILPKDDDNAITEAAIYGLDTSADVGDSHPGWQPPEGHVATVIIEKEDS